MTNDNQDEVTLEDIAELIFELRKKQIDRSFEENLDFFKRSVNLIDKTF